MDCQDYWNKTHFQKTRRWSELQSPEGLLCFEKPNEKLPVKLGLHQDFNYRGHLKPRLILRTPWAAKVTLDPVSKKSYGIAIACASHHGTVPSPCVTHSPASECSSNADCWRQHQTVLWICLEALKIAVKNQIIPEEAIIYSSHHLMLMWDPGRPRRTSVISIQKWHDGRLVSIINCHKSLFSLSHREYFAPPSRAETINQPHWRTS